MLNNKRQFANWIKQRIEQYGFIEIKNRYENIIKNPKNILDFMRLAIDEIDKRERI